MPDLPKDVLGLAGLFAFSGTVHLVRPQVFESIVPRSLPARRELVYVSGVAELLCAAGLLVPRTRTLAGWASAALLVAVFPANVTMARQVRRRGSAARTAVAVLRLPLQVPMIRTAVKAARLPRDPVRNN
ncbi:MAG: DoxX family protein [Propionibacteriaceae bacterium]